MENNALVSICCLAYNHEKYISKALDGMLMQKTNFKYEILIHDDASTDKTADIIREYEKKYPDVIKPIYQTENQYSKGVKINYTYQYPRAKGKYIAFCEGDDYWTCENKLQSQFDIMEKYENISICTHCVRTINESGELVLGKRPDDFIGDRYIPQEEFFDSFIEEKSLPFFQTSSYFLRGSTLRKMQEEFCEVIKKFPIGDVVLMLYFSTQGGLYYIDREWSSYRTFSANSWSNLMRDDAKRAEYHIRVIDGFKAYDEFLHGKKHEFAQKEILKREFALNIINNNYIALKDEKFRNIIVNLPLRNRLKYFIMIHFNDLFRFLKKIKKGLLR